MARAQLYRVSLPRVLNFDDRRPSRESADHPFGDLYLGRLLRRVASRRSHQSIEVAVFDDVRIGDHEMANAEVRKLLDHVRAPAAQADDADDDRAEDRVAVRPEKTLAGEVPHFFHQRNRRGAPISTTSESSTGGRVAGSQQRPTARSWLQTSAPCGIFGATLKKSGTNLALSRVSVELNRGVPACSCRCTWNIEAFA